MARGWVLGAVMSAVFAAGGVAGSLAPSVSARAGEAPPAASAPAPAPAPSETTCHDDAAMEANRNMVEQLRAANAMLAAAEAARDEATAKIAAEAHATPSTLSISKDEWSRMARAEILRVRTPCVSWNGTGAFEERRPNRGTYSSHGRRGDIERRAEAAGLEREELEVFADAYHRAFARTWDRMKAACADMPTGSLSIEGRVRQCTSRRVRPHDEATQRALSRVAELRAAGKTEARAETPEERVLLALTESTDALADELVRVLGRDKAKRAIDYGLVCVDDTIYYAKPWRPRT